MLQITTTVTRPEDSFPWYTSARWHYGEPKPQIDLDSISQVYADGDELAYIEGNFHNIPFNVSKGFNTWRGEFARFVVENL